MKKCVNCGNSCSDDSALFCPFCGSAYPAKQAEEKEYEFSQASTTKQDNMSEHSKPSIKSSSETARVIKGAASNVAQKVNNNAFVQAVRSDLHNSEAIQTVKRTVSQTAVKAKNGVSEAANNNTGRKRIAAIVAVVVVVIGLTLGLGLHRCEECDGIYFGKQHKVSFFGETEKVCKDCYDDFRSIW